MDTTSGGAKIVNFLELELERLGVPAKTRRSWCWLIAADRVHHHCADG